MDTVTLEEGLMVASADGEYMVHVHMHSELMTDENEWMIMLMDSAGDPLADTDFTANTYSEDCGHYGDEPMQELTTNAMGMATINPDFIHGGPWSVRIDVGADGAEGEEDIMVQLCVPGGTHGEAAGDGDHSEHMAGDGDGDGDHSEHMHE